MIKDQFAQYFNAKFWKSIKQLDLPIPIPDEVSKRKEIVNSVFIEIENKTYFPSPPEITLYEDKGGGVARIIPVFSVKDILVYYFCVKELESVLAVNRTQNTFGGWTLGGKLRRAEDADMTDYSRYSINPKAWTEAFGQFNSTLYSQLDTGIYSHILQFDLSNFYDSVRLDLLERWIREEADPSKSEVISLLFFFLNFWNRVNLNLEGQTVGLPMGGVGDCSRLLANFYLQKYDKFASEVCNQSGATYFRYSDDQMILLENTDKAPGILLLLTKKLDTHNLRVNQLKVKIWSCDDLQAHRLRDQHSIITNKKDLEDVQKLEKFVNFFLSLTDEERKEKWNGCTSILVRSLFGDIEGMQISMIDRIMEHYLHPNYLVRCEANQLNRIHELVNRMTDPVDFEGLISELCDTKVHNSFHYEALSFASKAGKTDLVKKIKNRIDELNVRMKTTSLYD